MSEAKVYKGQRSVRNITANQNKKTIYKAVVNSPFVLKWPTIHSDLGQTVITQLLKSLEPVTTYREALRKNKKKKEPKVDLQKPDLEMRIFVGINQVTRKLEEYIKKQHDTKKMPVLFICKREIKPLQLCQHLLYMAALTKVRLVPLPAESEIKLSQALHLNRSSVLLIEIMEDKEESLRLSTKDIPFIDAPWLHNALLRPVYYNTTDTIKTLETTLGNKKQKLKRDTDAAPPSDIPKKKMKLE